MSVPDAIFGVELEIEGFPNRSATHTLFMYKDDPSLRNNGKELVSYPTKAKYFEAMLTSVFKHYKITQEKNYTERCSTHVHMNAQDMTMEQVKVLALVYQTVERLLFGFVGNERGDNIYCVPWHQSGITAAFVDRLDKNPGRQAANWIKYAALNFKTLRELGTLEFRHLHGTCDVPFLIQWINLLSCMQRYASTHTFAEVKHTVLEMNTVSNYDFYLREIFQEHANVLTAIEDYKGLLSVGVIDTKLMLLAKPEEKEGEPRLFGFEAEQNDVLRGILERDRLRRMEIRPAPQPAQEHPAWFDQARGVVRESSRRHSNVHPTQERGYLRNRWQPLGNGVWVLPAL
jgi:hypothetical protein